MSAQPNPVPQAQPAAQQRPDLRVVPGGSAGQAMPGGFWRRFVASIMDGVICGVVLWPASMVLKGQLVDPQIPMIQDALINQGADPQQAAMQAQLMAQADPTYQGIMLLIGWAVVTVYFGFFYKTKGASPGKMAMGLRVMHADSGQNIGFLRTFLRETIGKTVSAMILMVGYIMAAFGQKRALHDYISGTRVVRTR